MNTCVVYLYESNKNHIKEDYESAYLCSFLRHYSYCDIYMLLKDHIQIEKKDYYRYFVKLYNQYQFEQLNNFILTNNISIDQIYFWGQYCRNNYRAILSQMPLCKGVILDDKYETIACIMNNEDLHKGIAYIKDGDLKMGAVPEEVSIYNIPKADRSISKKIGQTFAEVCFSKGCSKFCTFCTIGSTKKVVCKPNNMIVDELKSIMDETSIKRFVFKDLSFDDRILYFGKDSYNKLAQMISDIGIDIKYDVNFRIGSFSNESIEDQKIFSALRKSGMIRVLLGVESFVPRDLKLYNKLYEVKDIKATIDLCRANYIYPVCSFIFFNPYSAMDDIIANFTECYKLKLLDFLPAALNVLRPEERSPLFKTLEKDGLIYYESKFYHLKWMDEHVAILANKFEKVYADIDFWRRFLLLSELHELVNELEILGKRSKGNKTIDSINGIFIDLNETNFSFLMHLVEDAIKKDISKIDKRFELYIKKLDDDYCPKFRELYREIRKEIEIMKIVNAKTSLKEKYHIL